jgi:hypothetical protein
MDRLKSLPMGASAMVVIDSWWERSTHSINKGYTVAEQCTKEMQDHSFRWYRRNRGWLASHTHAAYVGVEYGRRRFHVCQDLRSSRSLGGPHAQRYRSGGVFSGMDEKTARMPSQPHRLRTNPHLLPCSRKSRYQYGGAAVSHRSSATSCRPIATAATRPTGSDDGISAVQSTSALSSLPDQGRRGLSEIPCHPHHQISSMLPIRRLLVLGVCPPCRSPPRQRAEV